MSLPLYVLGNACTRLLFSLNGVESSRYIIFSHTYCWKSMSCMCLMCRSLVSRYSCNTSMQCLYFICWWSCCFILGMRYNLNKQSKLVFVYDLCGILYLAHTFKLLVFNTSLVYANFIWLSSASVLISRSSIAFWSAPNFMSRAFTSLYSIV